VSPSAARHVRLSSSCVAYLSHRIASFRIALMASLLELSHELLHCIFIELDPADLAPLSRTCHDLHRYVRGNTLLHKDLYLRRYDEPKGLAREPDWEHDVRNLTRLERILESESRETKVEEMDFASRWIMRLIETAEVDNDVSENLRILSDHFDDTTNIDTLLCSSSLFTRAGNKFQNPAATEDLRQASAKLHCMYGVPIDHIPSRSTFSIAQPRDQDLSLSPSACTRLRTQSLPTHTFARSKVYDLRQYTTASLWGPFRNDYSQRVDWEKVEAVMIVLGFNLNKFTERSDGRWPRVWDKPFIGASPNSYLSLPPAAAPPAKDELEQDAAMAKTRSLAAALDAQDPYGVTGTWMRVVCFLDYNDLYAFNFSGKLSDIEDREPIDTEEGIIDLEEHVRPR
jgi:hypothetical protein